MRARDGLLLSGSALHRAMLEGAWQATRHGREVSNGQHDGSGALGGAALAAGHTRGSVAAPNTTSM